MTAPPEIMRAVEVEMVTFVEAIGAPVICCWKALVRVVAVVEAIVKALSSVPLRVVVEIVKFKV